MHLKTNHIFGKLEKCPAPFNRNIKQGSRPGHSLRGNLRPSVIAFERASQDESYIWQTIKEP